MSLLKVQGSAALSHNTAEEMTPKTMEGKERMGLTRLTYRVIHLATKGGATGEDLLKDTMEETEMRLNKRMKNTRK